MGNSLSPSACAILQAIVSFKQGHDGNAPTLEELAGMVGLGKSTIWKYVRELERAALLHHQPGSGRALSLVGGRWEWVTPRPFPPGRIGDVLRVVVAYKTSHDGVSPDHRQIAAALGVVYSGSIKVYLDTLAERGYITAGYATERYICVMGGKWQCDDAWLTAVCSPTP